MKFDYYSFVSRSELVGVKYLADVLNTLPPILEDGPWLAGGALRRLLINQKLDSDFDFFFKDYDQFTVWLEKIQGKCEKIYKNDHNVTALINIGEENDKKIIKVQGIKIQYYDSPESVIDSFDFTITQIAYDGKSLYFGEYTLWDLLRKRLAIHKVTYAISTTRRMIKYANQGFNVCSGCISELLQSVVKQPDLINRDFEYID